MEKKKNKEEEEKKKKKKSWSLNGNGRRGNPFQSVNCVNMQRAIAE
jgi:hypothetical protein